MRICGVNPRLWGEGGEFKAIQIVLTNLRQDINDEFHALPAHTADVRERLTSLATLLERDMGSHIDKGAAQ